MKKKSSRILLGVVLLSLALIGYVLATGWVKDNRENDDTKQENSSVLGEEVEILPEADEVVQKASNFIQSAFEDKVIQTKEVVTEKVIEAEKHILQTVEKEVTDLTEAQIEALKYNICKNLGVVPEVSPTSTFNQE